MKCRVCVNCVWKLFEHSKFLLRWWSKHNRKIYMPWALFVEPKAKVVTAAVATFFHEVEALFFQSFRPTPILHRETELKRQPRIFIIFEKIASYSFFPLRSVGIFLSSRVYFVSEMNKTRCIFIQIFKSEFYRRFGWCSIAKFSSAVFVANSP